MFPRVSFVMSVSFPLWNNDETVGTRQLSLTPSLRLPPVAAYICYQLFPVLGLPPPRLVHWWLAFFPILCFLSESVYRIKQFFLVCLPFFDWNIYNKTNAEMLAMRESCLGLGSVRPEATAQVRDSD